MGVFILPQTLHNRRGEVRKLGVELEFSGMPLEEAADAVRSAFGGELRRDHEYRFNVTAPGLGEFDVTFDSSLLSKKRYEEVLDSLPASVSAGVKGAFESALRSLGGAVLPLEIGSPPVPMDRLDELVKLEQALRQHNAQGTRAGLLYAFALHLNPEAIDPADPACLVATLRAFLLLYQWLFRKAEVDWTRRAMPFIDSFPAEYARLVIPPGYAPDLPTFTRDYLRHNPTRNRPLDLLPLLAFNDPEILKRPPLVGHKVSPRPTYHYRLPNSLIDDPEWSMAREWRYWVLLESLAASPAMMDELAHEYLHWDAGLLGYLRDDWVRHIDEHWVPRLEGQPQGVEA